MYPARVPSDPATGVMQADATVQEQTRLVLSNLQKVLQGCGADLKDVVKCSVFLIDVNDFSAMNEVYAEVFGAEKPARTTVGTAMVAARHESRDRLRSLQSTTILATHAANTSK